MSFIGSDGIPSATTKDRDNDSRRVSIILYPFLPEEKAEMELWRLGVGLLVGRRERHKEMGETIMGEGMA